MYPGQASQRAAGCGRFAARTSQPGRQQGSYRDGGFQWAATAAVAAPTPPNNPNAQLGSWFVRSGWSKGELARQVNRRARQMGAHHISTDTSRVRRWLDGEQPREPIPRILSELFSERFGCVVGIEELGLRPAHQSPSVSGVDLPWAGSQTVALISEFSRSDLMLARRGFLGTSLALAAGPSLIEPMQRWLVPVPAGQGEGGAEEPDRLRRPARLSKPELDLLEPTTAMFRQWDAQCGGGLRRKAVVGQLHEVTDLLQEPHGGGAPSASSRSPPSSPNWPDG